MSVRATITPLLQLVPPSEGKRHDAPNDMLVFMVIVFSMSRVSC